jgi:hypothetical protein
MHEIATPFNTWFETYFSTLKSKPEGHKGPCDGSPECTEMLRAVLDGYASPTQQQQFKDHIVECISCYDTFSLDFALKQCLHNKIERRYLTDENVDRLKAKIAELTAPLPVDGI